MLFKNSGVALITPFNADMSINYNKLEELIEFQIKNNTDAIILCGTTGESATLTDKEKEIIFKFGSEVINSRVPLIAGTGSNNTNRAIELSLLAKKCKADAVLSVTPFYNKCTQKGCIEHYKKIVKDSKIPLILYNVPSRTGFNLNACTIKELSEVPDIIAIKEADSDISKIMETKSLVSNDFDIYSGNDDLILPILSIGGIGVISVLANILPQETHEICNSYFNNDIETSRKLQLKYYKLIKLLFSEVNPIPVKEALNILGFNVGNPRLPLTKMESNIALKKELSRFF